MKAHRNFDYWMGWYVIVGTMPIGILGLAFKDQIRSGARNLWLISASLIIFALVIAAAEYYGRQVRHTEQLTMKDAVIVGSAQALALVPGSPDRAPPSAQGSFSGWTGPPQPIWISAGDPGRAGLWAVLAARRLPSGDRGHERDGPAAVGGDPDRVCDWLRRRRVVAAIYQ